MGIFSFFSHFQKSVTKGGIYFSKTALFIYKYYEILSSLQN